MSTGKILAVGALFLSGLVGLVEVGYYFAHPYRPGVSPHLIGLSASIVLVAVAQLAARARTEGAGDSDKPKRLNKLMIGAVLLVAVACSALYLQVARRGSGSVGHRDTWSLPGMQTPEYSCAVREAFEHGFSVADVVAARPGWNTSAIENEHATWQRERAAWRLWNKTHWAFRSARTIVIMPEQSDETLGVWSARLYYAKAMRTLPSESCTVRGVLRYVFDAGHSVEQVAAFVTSLPSSLLEAEHYAWLREKATQGTSFRTQECRHIVQESLDNGLTVDEIAEARPSWNRTAIEREYVRKRVDSLLYSCNSRVRKAWALGGGSCLVVLVGATVTVVRTRRRGSAVAASQSSQPSVPSTRL